ncbi:MAG TPA: DUF5652 family protein [Candidatus Dojkabacteria bacterium]|nr:DUF5652 family protein [Candidatus Dojkabacteria bacterium]
MDTLITLAPAYNTSDTPAWIAFVIISLAIWDAVWKGVALWKAAQNREKTWFVFLFVFNTLGILPILYIKFFQKRRVAI